MTRSTWRNGCSIPKLTRYPFLSGRLKRRCCLGSNELEDSDDVRGFSSCGWLGIGNLLAIGLGDALCVMCWHIYIIWRWSLLMPGYDNSVVCVKCHWDVPKRECRSGTAIGTSLFPNHRFRRCRPTTVPYMLIGSATASSKHHE